ncbi:MAG: hypothetical protein AAF081_09965 [Actinomycetota bacterium]
MASSVVIVAYGVDTLSLDWVPDTAEVIVVHNDDALSDAACVHPNVVHVRPGRNVGFGAGVNLGLARVTTERVILCNPDTALERVHFDALDGGDTDSIVTIPLVEADGTPNAVVNPYWTIPTFLATVFRLGRFAPRGGALRQVATRVLRGGGDHVDALRHEAGEWSLQDRWVTGALLSAPTEAMRAVGGFDETYFLYYEDADLQQRLAQRFPSMKVELRDVEPGVHLVGGCAVDDETRAAVADHRRVSAKTYAGRQPGLGWRLTEAMVGATS